MVATPKTALFTGISAGVIGYFLGPYVDHSEGILGSVALLIAGLVVAVPAYFFVFGLRKDQLIGFWVANPAILKRVGAWILGVGVTAALFQLLHYAT